MNLVYNKHKKLKPTCHILTITQIQRIGKLLQLPSLANSMEIFMEPANLFLFNKTKLNIIHQYLLDHDLTKVKKPSIRTKQPAHAQLLIDLIYPGYPIAKAREQAGRQDRESRSTVSKKGAVYFAYDQLPTTDAFERWDELVRLESSSPQPETCQDETRTYRYTINAKKLDQNLHRNEKHSIRLHLYVWMSPRHSLFPHFNSLKFNRIETWCAKDKETVDNRFKYVDITDKLDWGSIKSGESDMVDLEFSLDETLVTSTVKYVTICNVWEKSSTELVCQLYTQTALVCISSAMTANRDTGQIQREALDLLDRCPPKDRFCLDKTETLLLDCGRAFHQSLELRGHRRMDDSDDELTMGNEYISLMDPILLTKILHPARGNFCRHASCFDAKCFFRCYLFEQLWKCPICQIQIRGIQDLYIDYRLKQAITSYPDQCRFIYLQDGTYQTELEYQQPCDEPPLPSHRPPSPLVLKQQFLSPTPLSPLPQPESDSDINYLDISDVLDEKDMNKPASKRQKMDQSHQDIIVLLD